jgi:hypothetical protein
MAQGARTCRSVPPHYATFKPTLRVPRHGGNVAGGLSVVCEMDRHLAAQHLPVRPEPGRSAQGH